MFGIYYVPIVMMMIMMMMMMMMMIMMMMMETQMGALKINTWLCANTITARVLFYHVQQ